jgi:SAM-dependent methyltransferase
VQDFAFPADIPGWLTPLEGATLAALAAGRDVLEIGSWQGRSTVCLARPAKHVTAVDHFRGDAGTGPADGTEAAFRANLDRYGVAGKVTVHACDAAAAPLADAAFDLAFVDGAHDYASVARDLAIAARCVRPGGVIACHDWNYPEVRRAAADVLGWGENDPRAVTADSLHARAYKPKPVPKVFLGVPHRDDLCSGLVTGVLEAAKDRTYSIERIELHSTSLLALCFNTLWCKALNDRAAMGLTHFVMHHADIAPAAGWLAALLAELETSGADLVSCVVPIKDPRGLSSTAVMDPDSKVMRRLTLAECLRLPRTFSAADAVALWPEWDQGRPYWLLCNTGLWVCDFTKPWVEGVCFSVRDKIVKGDDGLFRAMAFSEDWAASVDLQKMGLRLRATNAVKLTHAGYITFPNSEPWGTWQTDQAKDERFDAPPVADLFPVPHVEPASPVAV